MNDNNMKIWSQVDKTDPRYTKKVAARGGYTSIDAMYQAKKATEVFGMYGAGWGLSKTSFNLELLEATGMIIHEAVFFYTQDEKRYEFPIHNAVKPMNGAKQDEDWPKKVETNTISKALSRLGFCADVFMGDFDDQDYVENRANEEAMEKAVNKSEEKLKQAREYEEWLTKHLALLSTSTSMSELSGLFTLIVRKCQSVKDDNGTIKATKAKDIRKIELTEQDDNQ